MLWLKTFGGAVLQDDEQPIGGAASHRRTVGLLAVLAAAGNAGLSRDKLIGIFWPDVPQRRARHSLTQALYAARRATGQDDLFDAGEDVRLNFEHIGCDLRDFEERLSSGDDESACELYRGPFLDGFFLQSPEFDQWQAQERARIEDRFVAAANRVIVRAENDADFAKAIEFARRLVSVRATDAAAVVNLMRLLARTGNRAAAIDQAEQYAAVMRGQYDIEPHPEVTRYASELKETPSPLVIADRSIPESLPPVSARDNRAAIAGSMRGPVVSRAHSRPRALAWSAVAVVAIIITIAAVRLLSRDATVPWSGTEPRTLIAPFRVRVTDDDLNYLSEGMIELLALRLADDSADRALDPATIIRAWRSADVASASEVPIAKLISVAHKLGAERVLIGSVVGNPRHLVIGASVVDVRSQQITTRASVEGAVDTLTSLVDGLARKLLLAEVEPQDRLTERLTVSLPSLRAHVRGTAAYARGDYALAQRFYERALRLDSTFTLAAFNLALSANRMADFETERMALDRAWRGQRNLSEKDQAHLHAALGPRYPAPSSLGDVVAAWTRAARLAPERAEVWAGLAGALQERLTAALNPSDRESVIAAAERALQLDAGQVAASVLLARVRPDQPLHQGGSAAIPAHSRPPFEAWWRAHNQGSASNHGVDSLETMGPATLRSVALAGQYAVDGLRDSENAIQLLLAKAVDANEAMSLLAAQHSIARNRRDEAAAVDATRRMQRTRPISRAHLRLRVLDALYDAGDSALAAAAARRLESSPEVSGAAADLCVRAQWDIARGDLEQAAATLELLRTQPAEPPIIASVQPAMCTPLIEAALAVAIQSDSAAQELQTLDSLSFTNVGTGDLAAYANIAVARMHRQLDAPESALAAIRRRPLATATWPRYLAASQQMEQELCALPKLGPLCLGEPAK